METVYWHLRNSCGVSSGWGKIWDPEHNINQGAPEYEAYFRVQRSQKAILDAAALGEFYTD